MAISRDIFGRHDLGGRGVVASGRKRALAAAKYPTNHRTAPPRHTPSKNYLAPNINRAEVEKPWDRGSSGETLRAGWV